MNSNASPAATPTRKRVAILQSNYLPWKGNFDLIHDVDLFVFYDDVQYTARDWRSRNRIKTSQGVQWISVPVGEDRNRLICDVAINEHKWQAKHWRTIEQSYGRCPHFERYRGYFEHIYLERTWTNLSELNHTLTRDIASQFLGLTTTFADSRDFQASGQKLDRLLELAQSCGATHYLSGPSARDYIVPERFAEAGITLEWKDYAGYLEYPQRFPPFEHAVSIIDLLFNTGPDAAQFIWGHRG